MQVVVTTGSSGGHTGSCWWGQGTFVGYLQVFGHSSGLDDKVIFLQGNDQQKSRLLPWNDIVSTKDHIVVVIIIVVMRANVLQVRCRLCSRCCCCCRRVNWKWDTDADNRRAAINRVLDSVASAPCRRWWQRRTRTACRSRRLLRPWGIRRVSMQFGLPCDRWLCWYELIVPSIRKTDMFLRIPKVVWWSRSIVIIFGALVDGWRIALFETFTALFRGYFTVVMSCCWQLVVVVVADGMNPATNRLTTLWTTPVSVWIEAAVWTFLGARCLLTRRKGFTWLTNRCSEEWAARRPSVPAREWTFFWAAIGACVSPSPPKLLWKTHLLPWKSFGQAGEPEAETRLACGHTRACTPAAVRINTFSTIGAFRTFVLIVGTVLDIQWVSVGIETVDIGYIPLRSLNSWKDSTHCANTVAKTSRPVKRILKQGKMRKETPNRMGKSDVIYSQSCMQ